MADIEARRVAARQATARQATARQATERAEQLTKSDAARPNSGTTGYEATRGQAGLGTKAGMDTNAAAFVPKLEGRAQASYVSQGARVDARGRSRERASVDARGAPFDARGAPVDASVDARGRSRERAPFDARGAPFDARGAPFAARNRSKSRERSSAESAAERESGIKSVFIKFKGLKQNDKGEFVEFNHDRAEIAPLVRTLEMSLVFIKNNKFLSESEKIKYTDEASRALLNAKGLVAAALIAIPVVLRSGKDGDDARKKEKQRLQAENERKRLEPSDQLPAVGN